MKSSDIKVLNIKNNYNLVSNENEILTKQAFELEKELLMHNNNNFHPNQMNFLNVNSFFLNDYEVINSPIKPDVRQADLKVENNDSNIFNNKVKIENHSKLVKTIEKQPIFPLKNEEEPYITIDALSYNDNHQLNCRNYFANIIENPISPLPIHSDNNKYSRKIARINAKVNYYRVKYEQLRVKKQLQIDWKCCRKHLSASCQNTNQINDNSKMVQIANINTLKQADEQLKTEPMEQEIADVEPISIVSEETNQFENNNEEQFNLDDLEDFNLFDDDFDDPFVQTDSKEVNFIVESDSDLLIKSVEKKEQQNIANIGKKINNKLQINFVETNPNQKRKSKHKPNFEQKLNVRKKSHNDQFEEKDDFNLDFSDFVDDEKVLIHNENDLTINSLLVKDQVQKLEHLPDKNITNIDVATDKVIVWNDFLSLILKTTLIAIVILTICLGLFFKDQINNSTTHWNIIWILDKTNTGQKNGWESFLYDNAFLITSSIYVILFVFPLIIFGQKKLFIISLMLFMAGLIIWTVFAGLGLFKYHSFESNKVITCLELSSLIVSWIAFGLFLTKLIRHEKHFKKPSSVK